MSDEKELSKEEAKELQQYLREHGYDKINQIDSYLYLPVHAQSWGFLFKSIPKRLLGFISKAISIKVAMFLTATFLFWTHPQEFGWWAWIIVFIVVAFGRDASKILKNLKNTSGR